MSCRQVISTIGSLLPTLGCGPGKAQIDDEAGGMSGFALSFRHAGAALCRAFPWCAIVPDGTGKLNWQGALVYNPASTPTEHDDGTGPVRFLSTARSR